MPTPEREWTTLEVIDYLRNSALDRLASGDDRWSARCEFVAEMTRPAAVLTRVVGLAGGDTT